MAFALAAMFLFSLKDAQGFSDNIIYHIALQAGLGRAGALAASFAVILSSIGTLETTMLQFSRTLYSMGGTAPMPAPLGIIQDLTLTPVRAMVVLIGLGLVMIFLSSFLPTIGIILSDSVNAIAVQVCYYYGLAGLVGFWVYRSAYRQSLGEWLLYAIFPLLSAVALILLGLYAISTFNMVTKVVGIGGLLIGVIFFRPSGYRA